MREMVRDIILNQSLFAVRKGANIGDKSMFNWYDGRLSSLNLIWPESIEIQGARNEVRFLGFYANRHFKR